jgi:hypothetical protein
MKVCLRCNFSVKIKINSLIARHNKGQQSQNCCPLLFTLPSLWQVFCFEQMNLVLQKHLILMGYTSAAPTIDIDIQSIPRNATEFAALSDDVAKRFYYQFCATEPTISNYLQTWWLDAVCPQGNWRPCLSFDNAGKVDGAMVYHIVKLKGFITAVVMPELTFNVGVWLRLPDVDKSKRFSQYASTKSILEKLIAQLPQTAFFHQKMHHSLTDWQPFYWQGFSGSTHYTYLLDNISDLDATFKDFKGSVRTDIRKAEKIVQIQESDDLDSFYELYKGSVLQQKIDPAFKLETFKRLDNALKTRGLRTLIMAKDTEGAIHAAIYITYDRTSAHYLVGCSDVRFRQSGALYLLIWEAIQIASKRGVATFDFEGSMIPSVEFAFRNFGARQVPFFRITRTTNRFFELLTLFFKNYK